MRHTLGEEHLVRLEQVRQADAVVRVGEHARSVHPTLARAALLGVRRFVNTPATAEVAEHLQQGTPVSETAHHQLLATLDGTAGQQSPPLPLTSLTALETMHSTPW